MSVAAARRQLLKWKASYETGDLFPDALLTEITAGGSLEDPIAAAAALVLRAAAEIAMGAEPSFGSLADAASPAEDERCGQALSKVERRPLSSSLRRDRERRSQSGKATGTGYCNACSSSRLLQKWRVTSKKGARCSKCNDFRSRRYSMWRCPDCLRACCPSCRGSINCVPVEKRKVVGRMALATKRKAAGRREAPQPAAVIAGTAGRKRGRPKGAASTRGRASQRRLWKPPPIVGTIVIGDEPSTAAAPALEAAGTEAASDDVASASTSAAQKSPPATLHDSDLDNLMWTAAMSPEPNTATKEDQVE